jgi:hypothetical protein
MRQPRQADHTYCVWYGKCNVANQGGLAVGWVSGQGSGTMRTPDLGVSPTTAKYGWCWRRAKQMGGVRCRTLKRAPVPADAFGWSCP